MCYLGRHGIQTVGTVSLPRHARYRPICSTVYALEKWPSTVRPPVRRYLLLYENGYIYRRNSFTAINPTGWPSTRGAKYRWRIKKFATFDQNVSLYFRHGAEYKVTAAIRRYVLCQMSWSLMTLRWPWLISVTANISTANISNSWDDLLDYWRSS